MPQMKRLGTNPRLGQPYYLLDMPTPIEHVTI